MRVWNQRQYFFDSLTELVGIKAGVVLTRERMLSILEEGFDVKCKKALILGGPSRWWEGDEDAIVGLRAEEIEFDFLLLMHYLGAVSDLRGPSELTVDFILDHAQDLGVSEIDKMEVAQRATQLSLQLSSPGDAPQLTGGAVLDHPDLEQLQLEYSRRFIMHRDAPEDRTWDGQIHLDDLFKSEDIPVNTPPECYFDQRFIDHLSAQPQNVTSIHWRQFEYLTAEYFQRHGYTVTVGKGRQDGGVDISAIKNVDIIGPDLVVIQCRRHGDDKPVGVDAVRAFWATVNDQGATRGLIATTSRLTGGAKSYCEARRYRLTASEGDAVRKWISELASACPRGVGA